ncbi:MAG TPA: amidohydrolase family protein, partial [Myxococcales bacterium]|nr:amidohydrolase family protein [Myxococcales bacterium]
IEKARAAGVDISANMYPYAAARNGLDANVPEWAHEGGVDAMIARFHDPATRARIEKELWHGGLGAETPDGITIAEVVNPALEKYVGQHLDEVARAQGKTPEDALLDLVEADRAQTGAVRFVMSEDDVRLGLRQPWVAMCTDDPGHSSDGPFAKRRGHPRGFGAAPRLLGHYAREVKLFSIEEAVRKMTSLPARRMRLADRGVLRPGMAADLVVFDPDKVIDRATFADPNQYPVGIDVVVVNGKVVLDEGKLTAERPGIVLRR